MNDRIIELRKEAYNLVQIDLQTNERDEVVDNREHLKMVFDKFAELIVRECICQCDDENSQKYIMSHFGFTEKDWS
jgi:phosphatidylserine decarboxylase